jgi:hypothetical protein
MAKPLRSAKDSKPAERAFEVVQKLGRQQMEVRGESGSCSES